MTRLRGTGSAVANMEGLQRNREHGGYRSWRRIAARGEDMVQAVGGEDMVQAVDG